MDCIAIQSPCPRHSQAGRWTGRWERGWASWARRQALGSGRWGAGAAGARARRRQTRRGARSVGGAQVRGAGSSDARGTRQAPCLGAGRAACARGLAKGCALSAHSLFSIRFDSVLFLSRFLDIIREPGS